MQVEAAQLEDSIQEAAEPVGRQATDKALVAMLAMSREGKLHGRVYGRLNSLAKAKQPEMVMAVNAVLGECCNLVCNDRGENIVLSTGRIACRHPQICATYLSVFLRENCTH